MSGSGLGGEVGGGPRARTLETILRSMPAAVVIADAPSGRVVMCSEQVAALWRRPLASAATVEEYASWEAFHPDGRRFAAEDWPLARSVLRGESVDGEEIEIVRGDGTRAVLRACSVPIHDADGTVVSAVATFHDITAQWRLETARRTLTQAGEVLGSSVDYRVTLAEMGRLAVPALAHWCGVDLVQEGGRVERVVSEHVDRARADLARELGGRYLTGPATSGLVARVLRTARAELHPEITEELLRAWTDDEEHLRILRELGLLSVIIVPIVARGKTLGALTLALDRPGRAYGPDDLEVARDLAVRAALTIDNARLYEESTSGSRAKSDFVAVMSHELRTPLTAIIGYAELLDLGIPEPVTERQREQVQRIEASARHLQVLIEEVLTVASLETTAGARLRPQRVALSELLRRAEDVIRPVAEAKELQLHAPPLLRDVVLETDPEKFLQILLNLLSNAVKFTSAGEIRVSARESGGFVEVTVTDTGVGVAMEHHERIFEPFWQVEQPITRRAGGTGLGLTISRRLADLLGGEIRVHSHPGKGSSFTARVPVRSRP